MKTAVMSLLVMSIGAGCTQIESIDTTPPSSPRGIRTVSLDNAVELSWLANPEHDLAGYKVWTSDRYDGRYTLLGTTPAVTFVDFRAINGMTAYYAVSAYDLSGNESPLSVDVVYDTPRPEGYGVQVTNYRTLPSASGYDFSTYSIGPYDDLYTDVFYERVSGRSYFLVWDDTDIQDMGYTETLDDISAAPLAGWAPSKSAEAIVGHTYVVWTWDDRYSKIRVTGLTATGATFDWAYQTAEGNRELKIDPAGVPVRAPLRREGSLTDR